MEDCKKKITIFINSMGGGGAERVVSLLLKPLSKEYNVTLIVIFPVFSYNVPENIEVISLLKNKPRGRMSDITSLPLVTIRYLNLIRKIKPDITLSFLFKPNLINSLTKLFFKKKKVILSERNYPSIMYSSTKLRLRISHFLIQRLYSKADIIFSNSEWINQDLKVNFGVKKSVDFYVIYNPIILPTQTKNNVKVTGGVKIVSVGRLIELKNHKLILRALKAADLKKNYSLTIYGSGPLKESLIDYANQISLKDFFLPGFSINVRRDLLKYDLFILSSISEGFPNALLEAMAVGLPVISTNCKSGPLELLNSNEEVFIRSGEFYIAKYGILINPDDAEGLSKAISYIVEKPELFYLLSVRAKNRAKAFSIDSIYKDFCSMLKK